MPEAEAVHRSFRTYTPGFLALLLICIFAHQAGAQQSAAEGWQEDFNNGTLALRDGRASEAVTSFTSVTRKNPTFAAGYFNLGLALASARQHKDAVEALEHAAKLAPRQHGVHLFLGIENYNLSRFAAAEEALNTETRLFPKDAKAWMWLGVVDMSEAKTADAAHALDQAGALDPDDVDIEYHRGRAHMQLSQEVYADMFARHPSSWRIHQVLAQSLDLQERKADAIVEYRRAIEVAPDEPGLHEALGDLYWEQNQIDDARAVYKEEIRIDPTSANSLYKTGAIAVQQSDAAGAVPLLQQALEINPDLYGAKYWLGRAQEGLENYGEAAKQFETVLKESGDDLDTQIITEYHLAQAYRKLHETEKWSAAMARFKDLRKTQTEKSDQRLAEKRRVQLGMNRENLDAQEQKQGEESKP
jgi:tetratricopeptide (TPR) repeat protein